MAKANKHKYGTKEYWEDYHREVDRLWVVCQDQREAAEEEVRKKARFIPDYSNDPEMCPPDFDYLNEMTERQRNYVPFSQGFWL